MEHDSTPSQDPPRIEFPCDYPIKVMGEPTEDFAEAVLEIVRRHDPGMCAERVGYRASSNGRYLSVQVVITATGTEQITALFEDLKASGRVAMVL